ncbi:4Fe-4S dicluster domain-containing protein [Candidatus Latescibacterota bacterium]
MQKDIRENPGLCFQCSKCSAGCPVAEEMDILPHQVIHYASLGMNERVLESKTIWMCAGCFTCAVRCPNDIDITSVMDELRGEAVEKGVPCPKPDVLSFHRTFLRDIGRRGRLHEMRMMTENNFLTKKPFHNVALAPFMLLKGRLPILPPKSLKGFRRWMKKLWK